MVNPMDLVILVILLNLVNKGRVHKKKPEKVWSFANERFMKKVDF